MGPFFFTNIGILVLATLGNCLALQGAVLGEFVFSGYRCFLISLLISDLYVVGINFVLFALQGLSYWGDSGVDMSHCIVVIVRRLAITGFIANLLSFSAMSIDHFIGLILPLKYRHIMKETTIIIVVLMIWTISLSAGFADYPIRLVMTADVAEDPPTTTEDYTTLEEMISIEPPTSPQFSRVLASSFLSRASRAILTKTFKRSTALSKLTTTSLDGLKLLHSNDKLLPQTKSGATRSALKLTTARPLPTRLSDKLNYKEISIASSSLAHAVSSGQIGTSIIPSIRVDDEQQQISLIDQLFDVEETTNRCDNYFDPQYNIWLECIALVLAVTSMAWLSITSLVIYRQTVLASDVIRRKLKKLIFTTLLLLFSFSICWLPYTLYEIVLVLISQTDGDFIPETKTDYLLHNILYSLFMFSQVAIPVCYIAKNRVVQRHLIQRYGRILPDCLLKSCICINAVNQAAAAAANNSHRNSRAQMSRASFGVHRESINNYTEAPTIGISCAAYEHPQKQKQSNDDST